MTRKAAAFGCHNIHDLREAARRFLPRGLFEFIDRGAEDELCLERDVAAFRRVRLLPRVLRDVSRADPAGELLGGPAAFPLAVAPTGGAGMVRHHGDLLLARAAAAAGVPFAISSASNMEVEQICRAGGRLWFQLYLWEDRSLSMAVVERARAAGCEALVVTADIPVSPNREYNRRNGFASPFRLGFGNAADILSHPRWFTAVMLRYLREGGMPAQANLPRPLAHAVTREAAPRARFRGDSLTWDEVARMRDGWPGRFVLKGLLRPDDAERAVALGVDGIVVSNHGGRSLDCAAATLEALPDVVAAVSGRAEVLVDSGVRRGSDIAKALALGARGVLAGRAPLYGLAAGGQAGVEYALDLLKEEFVRTMGLCGARDLSELDAGLLWRSPAEIPAGPS
ncbi:alpha-hydroxy acid oxidase [Sphingomonas canadensis]|uniref:Alpha-hydroxy acid oxidase n=1 Tax=Sphingomonas canadensis TaxID=1219257 RepID=A0ABW3HBX4_9SPHN|nr:alpha-hydroxy acid oxidase [Sphingomonas canadensis]MCW3837597.1 alpha-hydroxy-acid oxidizing protein [Sphingomonas canadensis]